MTAGLSDDERAELARLLSKVADRQGLTPASTRGIGGTGNAPVGWLPDS